MKKHAYVPCPNYGPGWNHPSPHCEKCNQPEDHPNHRYVVVTVFVDAGEPEEEPR